MMPDRPAARAARILAAAALISLPLPASPLQVSFIQEEIADTNGVADTLEVPVRVLVVPGHGSIQDGQLPSMDYLDHLLIEYTSSVDNISRFPGVYVRHMGAVGQPHEVTVSGTGWRGVGVMIDGRNAIDPMSGVYDLNLYPTEFIGAIEYLPPSRSFIYQRNAVGAGFNIVSQNYIAPAPYSKVRYSQGGHNYSQTDVVLSQDAALGLNIMAGMQRQFFGYADPVRLFSGRFPNMNYRNQHYRTKVRWNLPNRVNVAAHYLYGTVDNGLSGGIDIFATPPDEIFEDIEATMRSNISFQRIERHDLTFTASAILLPDSLDTSSFSIFYSNHYRDYREADRAAGATELLYRNDYRTLLSGLDFKQWVTVGPVRFHAGGSLHDVHVTRSETTGKQHEHETAVFFRSIFEPFREITANVSIRGDWIGGLNYTSYGADLSLSPFAFAVLTGGGVHSYRHPTLQERYWEDSTVVRPPFIVPEAHDMLFAEFTIKPAERLSATIGASYRYITDPIYYEAYETGRTFPGVRIIQGDDAEVLSGYLSARYSIGRFSFTGLLNYYRLSEDGMRRRTLPNADMQSSVVYRGLVFNGALDLQVKLEGIYIAEQFGTIFDPETYFSMPQRFARIGPSTIFNGSIVGRISSAYIHITYQNIAGTEYMKTPFYPMLQSYLRFGITWEFLN
jgi:hypothetical protein